MFGTSKRGDEKMYETIALQNSKNAYGAFELKRLYPRNYSFGLTIAAFFHMLIIAVYLLSALQQKGELNIPQGTKRTIIELGTPPSLKPVPLQSPQIGTALKASKGIPVPVPDAMAVQDQTIFSQKDLDNTDPFNDVPTNGNVTYKLPEKLDQPEENPNPDEYVPVEKLPTIAVQAAPIYPELAIRAGEEGRVWAKILVGKDGVPKEVKIIKSDREIFNQATIEAAMKYRFTPAIQNNKPIAVWIVVPFKFELRGK